MVKMNWSNTAFLVRSPLIRLAASIPLFGYIVLYGDSFRDLFDFSDAFGQSYLLFSTTIKTRLVYYGAILLGISFLIYYFRCPPICKRLSSSLAARDEFVRIGTTDDLYKILDTIDFETDHNRNRAAMSELISETLSVIAPEDIAQNMLNKNDGKLNALESELSLRVPNRNVTQRTLSNQLKTFLKELSSITMLPPDAVKQNLKNDLPVIELYSDILCLYYPSVMTAPFVRACAQKVYEEHFIVNNGAMPCSQILVLTASIIGLFLFCLPAVDVFLQVVLTDTGLLETP